MSDEVIVGGYRRVGVMQTGQNCEVWIVTEVGGQQRFAMKLLLQDKVGDASQRKLLSHEANIAMKLEHPRIIRVFKYHSDKRQPFLLMELFPSKNLKLRAMRNEFDSFIKPKMRKILEQAADAIGFVHEHGWVHRDIKPDNLLVSDGGQLRLIDFALAVRTAGTFSRMFGRPGKTAGTRSYMSPEQIRGMPLDARADIYSFGVMLFELVSGKLPFVANSAAELFKKHLSLAPPSIDPSRNVTSQFEGLIRQLLAKKPADRPKSMREFREELRGIKIFKDEIIATES